MSILKIVCRLMAGPNVVIYFIVYIVKLNTDKLIMVEQIGYITRGGQMTSDLEEIIKRAQEQPGVADVIEVQRMYLELLQQSGVFLEEITPDAIGSYSTDAS
jgi:hypothetical protein